MEKIDKAIYIATEAHNGQKRKGKDVDMILHPFSVGMILKSFGCEEDVVIAGILHDTVEDTYMTYYDIEKEFGKYVMNLVKEASERDKSLSWEERKEETIEKSKSISYEGKLLVAADKISNLSLAYEDYKEIGNEIWECTKRGYEKQKWYYTELLNSLRCNACDNSLFRRYEELNSKLFSE